MIFWSHGEGSSLLEHLREVMSAAESFSERVTLACHDIGKATHMWQKYIRQTGGKSPHNHAASGGVLAASILMKLNDPESALIALHAAGAHHGFLSQILSSNSTEEYRIVFNDNQAKGFFLDTETGIASLLPEIPLEILRTVWTESGYFGDWNVQCDFAEKLMDSISVERRLSIALRARFLLGRLCLADWQSASKQSGEGADVRSWRELYPNIIPRFRLPRDYPDRGRELDRLRRQIKESFHAILKKDACFYFIDAPTGLGKTEAMLSGAEMMLNEKGYERIVFGVPQVSIADQIFADYFKTGDHAQIWNYRRQEKTTELKKSAGTEEVEPFPALKFALEQAQHPFSETYNITTFNQILLAMAHPRRNRCAKGLGLRNTVIIMDEFHKLPMLILPYFFRIAREYAAQFNCCFILGSATPLAQVHYLDLEDSERIPENETGPVYCSSVIDSRRYYVSIGALTVAEVGKRILDFHNESDQNLLVVVNLVGDGSWPLRRVLGVPYSPWEAIEAAKTTSDTGRLILFLDGLVPPCLRRDVIETCKTAMLRRAVTLVATQMVEVGVDLDFDVAMIDYQGLAATLQRGGRVGREGERNTPCQVEVFSLKLEGGGDRNTSFNKLNDIEAEHNSLMKLSYFETMVSKIHEFKNEENKFFETWVKEGCIKKDSELADFFLCIQKRVWSTPLDSDWIEKFLSMNGGSGNLGMTLLHLQHIAELSQTKGENSIIVFETYEDAQRFFALEKTICDGCSTEDERKMYFKKVRDHEISISDKTKKEMELNYFGTTAIVEKTEVYFVKGAIL